MIIWYSQFYNRKNRGNTNVKNIYLENAEDLVTYENTVTHY